MRLKVDVYIVREVSWSIPLGTLDYTFLIVSYSPYILPSGYRFQLIVRNVSDEEINGRIKGEFNNSEISDEPRKRNNSAELLI